MTTSTGAEIIYLDEHREQGVADRDGSAGDPLGFCPFYSEMTRMLLEIAALLGEDGDDGGPGIPLPEEEGLAV